MRLYEDEGVVSDLRYVRSRSVLVEEIESLDRLIHWLEMTLSQTENGKFRRTVRGHKVYFISVREKCVI